MPKAKNFEPAEIANYIKQLRENRGWNQIELAKKVGVSRGTIQNLEGAKNPQQLKNLSKILAVLEEDIEEKPPEKRFDFSAKLSDKEKGDLLKMIDAYDGIGRFIYAFLNRRFRDEPVEKERRR